MWTNFKNWMATAKAGAIVNGSAAVIWGGLAVSSDSWLIRLLFSLNAVLLAHLSGEKLTEHFMQPRLEMKDAVIEGQHRLIMELIQAQRELLRQEQDALEAADDQGLS